MTRRTQFDYFCYYCLTDPAKLFCPYCYQSFVLEQVQPHMASVVCVCVCVCVCFLFP